MTFQLELMSAIAFSMRSFNQIAEQTLLHMHSCTTDCGEAVTTNPTSSYLDEIQYQQEMKSLFRDRPIPTIAATEIPNINDYVTKTICGVPIIIYRNSENQIKVFLNVCRHRGAKLTTQIKSDNCKTFTCPFHGWKYPEGKNLTELKSYEFVGMIWVLLNPQSDFSMPESLSLFADDLNTLSMAPRFGMPETVFHKNFNWKIGVEAFLEVDHFPFAHAPHLENIQYPGLSLADQLRENFRIVVPLKKPEPQEFILNWSQVMYFIFPSSFLLVYSDHVALLSLIPLSIDSTEFRYLPLVQSAADLISDGIQKKVDFLKVILQQDFAILEDIQKGLTSGANTEMTFTRTEHVLNSFHQSIKR
ncbi:MAG: aromatic ring-hydroxylating dioxygenase subunit alpha [Bdellovibrionota bacterium]